MLKLNKNQIKDLDYAKDIAIHALSLLVGDENRLMNFVETTGIDMGDIRELAKTNEFLAAVLDYFIHDEKYLLEFCGLNKYKTDTVLRAAHDLGGGIWESDTA